MLIDHKAQAGVTAAAGKEKVVRGEGENKKCTIAKLINSLWCLHQLLATKLSTPTASLVYTRISLRLAFSLEF